MEKYIHKLSKSVLSPIQGCPHRDSENGHLTIARGISKDKFIKLWPIWENAAYQSSTRADRMLLLRRPLSNPYNKYEVIGEFPFLGKGTFDAQMELF